MKNSEFRSVLKIPFKLLRISGMMRTRDASILYRIWSFAFRMFGIDAFLFCQLVYAFSANTVLEMSDALTFSFTYVIMLLKWWSYSGNMDNILGLLDELDEFMLLLQVIEEKALEKLKPRFAEAQIFFRIFWALCFATTFMGGLIPIIAYLINPNPPYTVAYKTWFPFDHENELGPFIFVAIYEAWNGMFFCGVVAATDVLPVIIFNAGAGLLEELGDRMSCIGNSIASDQQDEDKKQFKLNLVKLERCIALHLKIKRFIRKAEEIFSFMIFVQGAVSLIILCTSAFSLSKISPRHDFAQFVLIVIYLCPMVLQILLPCYFANEISIVSANLSTHLFHSSWYKENKNYRIAMKMFMGNTITPVIIKAANGFFHVNLSGFLRIMNLAYSVYALLQRIN